MLITTCQILILLFGISSIWFVSRKESWRKWGYILGLCGQPFWLIYTISTKQWGILLLTLCYTYSWSMGIYNFWIKK